MCWKQWHEAGINCISDLFDETTKHFSKFDQISAKYNLQRNQFWRHIQLQSTLSKWLGNPLTCPTGSPVEELMTKALFQRRVTPRIYHILQERTSDPLQKVNGQWVNELSLDISPEEWRLCLTNINTLFKEIGSKFVQLKIIHRWHWTPQKLHKWNLIPSDCCWRCGGAGASITHILLLRPVLKYWWNNIQHVLFKVVKKHFPITVKLFMLGITTEPKDSGLSSSEQSWVVLAITTAKLLRHWKKDPPREEWATTMAQLASYERVSYSYRQTGPI